MALRGNTAFEKLGRGVYGLKGARRAKRGKKAGTGERRTAAKAEKKALPAGPAEKPKRIRKPVSLKDALAQVMAAKASVAVGEAMQAVLAAGYRTSSKDFRLLVNQALLRGAQFANVGRGRYALKA